MKITSFRGDYAFLSNFYASPITMPSGRVYSTAEHLFQAAKTLDPSMRSMIRAAETPGLAKRLGRTLPLRDDWQQIRVGIMTDVLTRKFPRTEGFASSALSGALIATGEAWLEEGNTWGDRFWGTVDGDGSNVLGLLLMIRRGTLIADLYRPLPF